MKSNIFTTALLACLASSTAATPLDPRATPKPNLVEVVVTEVTTTYAIHIKHYYKYNGIYSWDDNWSLTVTNAPTSINLRTSATSTSLSTTTILTIYDGGKGKTKTSTTTQIAGATTSSIEAVDSTSSVVSTTPSKSATSSSVISKSTSSTASSSSKSSTTSSIKTSSTSTKSATTSSSIHASSSTIPSSTSVKSSTTLSKVVSSSTSKSSSTTLSKSSSSTTSAKPTTTTSSISQTQPNCGIYATDISEAGWQQSAGNYAGSNASDCYFFCLRDRNYCTSVAYAGPGVMPEGQECIILQYKANSPNLLGVTTTPTSASAFTIYDADCAPPPAATPVVKSAAVCNATWDVWGGPSWNLPDSSTIETLTLGTPAECKAECARLEGYCASWAWFPASYSQCTILNVAIETPGAYGDMNPSDPQSDVGYASDAGCP